MGYGTGAIMAVPAHDDRDWEFAKKFGCEIIEVVSGGEDVQKAAFTAKDETGILVNSDFLNGKTVKDAIPAMIEWLEREGHRPRQGAVQAARLGILPSALLGRTHSDRQVRQVRLRSAAGGPASARRCRMCDTYEPTDNGESPLATHDRLGEHHLPVLRRPGQARDRHHAPVGRLVVVLPALHATRTTTRRSRPRRRSNTGRRLTGTTAAWSTPRCICCTAVSGTSSCMTSALFRPRSRMQSARATA